VFRMPNNSGPISGAPGTMRQKLATVILLLYIFVYACVACKNGVFLCAQEIYALTHQVNFFLGFVISAFHVNVVLHRPKEIGGCVRCALRSRNFLIARKK